MADLNDFEKAENIINDIIKLRDDLINASPYLNNVKSHLGWYKKVLDVIPEEQQNILSILESPIQSTLNIEAPTFNVNYLTGLTGSYFSISGDTMTIVKSYGSEHYNLVNEYYDLTNTEDLIDSIIEIITTYRDHLQEFNPVGLLIDAKEAYAKWKVDVTNNSDLAKEIRAFQDVFNGLLKRAWVYNDYNPLPKKYPDFSWPKISESLGKVGGCKKNLQKLQGSNENLHLAFTEIMKKTKVVDKSEMDRYFRDYIEHVYSIVNLIDSDIMK